MMRSLAFHAVTHMVRSAPQASGLGGLAVTLYRRGLSLLARLALGGMVAAVAAILIGAVATAGGLVQLLVTGFAALALWMPAFLLVSRIADWRRRRRARQAVSGNCRTFHDLSSTSQRIDAAWGSLALAAAGRHAEVRRIEGQLASVWKRLPAQSLDPQVHELKLLIGNRIPQLIETQLSCLPLRRSERGAAMDALLDLLGEFTEDSVRRFDRIAEGGRNQHQVVRRRIEDHLGRGNLSPLG